MLTIADAIDLALDHHRAGRLGEAEALYRGVLAADPGNAGAMHLLGVLAHQVGRHEVALDYIGRAIARNGDVADFHWNMGVVLRSLDRLGEAVASFEASLALAPQAIRFNELGEVYHSSGNPRSAAECFRRSLAIEPHDARVRSALGEALRSLGSLDEAEQHLRLAIADDPDLAEAHGNLGALLHGAGRLDEAMASYGRCLALDPTAAETHANLGLLFMDQGRLTDAETCCRRAIDADPTCASAHNNLGLVLLSRGALPKGFAEYAWRWRTPAYLKATRALPGEPWTGGDDVKGRRLLVYAEQGLGDTIHFVRFLPMLAAMGCEVVLECQRLLAPLLADIPGAARVVGHGDPLPPCDLNTPLMCLPRHLGTTLATIPAPVPYLRPDPRRLESWRSRLATGDGLRVGLHWQGNPAYRKDGERSIGLDPLHPLLRLPGVRFFGLQMGPARDDAARLPKGVAFTDVAADFDPEAGAFVEQVALMASLDLIVTSDTALAHVAGAAGVRTWVLLSAVADWRWLQARSDSPWYPTMRLFRQPSPGDWDHVVREVVAALMVHCQAWPQ